MSMPLAIQDVDEPQQDPRLQQAIALLRLIAGGGSKNAAMCRDFLESIGEAVPPGKRLFGSNGCLPGRNNMTRFRLPPHVFVPRSKAALQLDHPALAEGRTIFTSRVFAPERVDRVLVSGHSAAKIGRKVMKGPWRDMPIFTLTLEERATCPRSCTQWDTCYGNSTPAARRIGYDPDYLLPRIQRELAQLSAENPKGFVVRLHLLGDFPDVEYVIAWRTWMRMFPALHVFGYSARSPEDETGHTIYALNEKYPDRWAVRHSVEANAAPGPMEATVIWRSVAPGVTHVAEGMICPQQLGRTELCATCGLCWEPDASHLRIVFLGHGGLGAEAR